MINEDKHKSQYSGQKNERKSPSQDKYYQSSRISKHNDIVKRTSKETSIYSGKKVNLQKKSPTKSKYSSSSKIS